MMAGRWDGSGAEYAIDWGASCAGSLQFYDALLGLRSGAEGGPLLASQGLSAIGRWDTEATSGRSLVNVEERHGRIQAARMSPKAGTN